jgi:Chaperone of endosialidase
MFINSSTRTGDGGVNTGTLRNDAGDLRLQAAGAVNGLYVKGTTGNVGIGTTSPSTLLDVRGTIYGTSIQAVSGGATSNGGYVTLQVGSATNTGYVEFRNTDSSRMCYIGYGDSSNFAFSVEQSRNIIFSTNSVERMRIANTGDVTCTGDISAFASTSDIRLKENIIVLPSALNIIKLLNPVTFNWKDDIYNEMYRGKEDVGFIAQEVEQVIPYAVGDFEVENNKYKKIRHERILPYVVKSVQELEQENVSMKNTITELTNENNSMKEQLARLMAWAQTMGMN